VREELAGRLGPREKRALIQQKASACVHAQTNGSVANITTPGQKNAAAEKKKK